MLGREERDFCYVTMPGINFQVESGVNIIHDSILTSTTVDGLRNGDELELGKPHRLLEHGEPHGWNQ